MSGRARRRAHASRIDGSDLRQLTETRAYDAEATVCALDGSIIDDENFANVMTDIAVLRSLNIDIVLVHGVVLASVIDPPLGWPARHARGT